MTRFMSSVWQLQMSCYVTPSLTEGRLCNLLVQLLLGLARSVTLGSKSRKTHDHVLLSHFRFLNPGGLGTAWPRYAPEHWVGFSSPLTNGWLLCSWSYVTDDQSASFASCRAPIWSLRPDVYYCWTFVSFLMWDALSDERTGTIVSVTTFLMKPVIHFNHNSLSS
jgi:hypothetical protein